MIYFDNAATSWPKPDVVRAALESYLGEAGGNPGRSGHRMSVAAAYVVEDAREALAGLCHVANPSRIVFTQNATHALNQAIYGLFYGGFLQPGDHVLTTSMEHNSVMRPLRHLESLGVQLTVARLCVGWILGRRTHAGRTPAEYEIAGLYARLQRNRDHPAVAELAALAHEYGALVLLDASQTAGAIPIDIPDVGADLFAFTGA